MMDTGKGHFERLDAEKALDEQGIKNAMAALEAKHPGHGGWFREGEEVVLKGSRFRVKRIKPTEITLKLLERGTKE